ncbi:MAG TPA: SIMPL domain-containing protein, partial [Candidatus Kapabacteria bacterium]|nr:SIMPL domain-containing protein [Candidatus Kapabacteria bacterium]
MTTFRHIPIIALLSLPLAVISAAAQAGPTAEQLQFIRVTGEAVIGSAPDEVMIDLGVTTQARTAQAAASENAAKVERVMAMLKKEAGEGATVRTTQYALNPDYRPMREENEQPTITSYSAYNMVQVRTRDLTRIGRIIDAAIAAGANTIQSVSFSINEQNKARNQALTEATANAMVKAEAIAAGLKMRVKRVLSVDEGGGMMPMYRGG